MNVLFDPDYTPKQVHVELNNVTLEEALSIISFETKTFCVRSLEYHFCRGRHSCKAERAGTKRHQDFLSF